jgi:hypothetical protein
MSNDQMMSNLETRMNFFHVRVVDEWIAIQSETKNGKEPASIQDEPNKAHQCSSGGF